MQAENQTLVDVLHFAADHHAQVEIVSRQVGAEGTFRYTYADAWLRVNQLSSALRNLGVTTGDRIATFAWNTHRHWEAWYAIAGLGAICHTINLRLFLPQVEFILNHARDKLLLVDAATFETLCPILHRLPHLQGVIVLCEQSAMPQQDSLTLHCYESLLASEPTSFDWPRLSPELPSSLCYTSGTTGLPKGVLYTHRSNLLHARATMAKGALGISCQDSILMLVPMFHANSWGLAYSCPMAGAKLVLPANHFEATQLCQLLQEEQVSFSAGVPTLWAPVLEKLQSHAIRLPALKEINIGGAPPSRSLIEGFDAQGIQVIHGWGMTELSPVGTICRLKSYMQTWPLEQRTKQRLKQGLPLFGVTMRLVNDQGREVPHDGTSPGRLLVKGPWIAQQYYREVEPCVDAAGWFDTGDIATIDEHGYLQITDRAKDLIKSGGEWISSVELEQAVLNHPAVQLAAVIALPDERWGERPRMILQLKSNSRIDASGIRDFLADFVPKWWKPEKIHFIEDMPLTGSGKVDKLKLREWYASEETTSENSDP